MTDKKGWGGKREGAGRKTGARNVLTLEMLDYAKGQKKQPWHLWYEIMNDASVSEANRLRASENLAKYLCIPVTNMEEVEKALTRNKEETLKAIMSITSKVPVKPSKVEEDKESE